MQQWESVSRGRDPGYEFVFTLSNVTASDAGTYDAILEVTHPATGSSSQLTKSFTLEGMQVMIITYNVVSWEQRVFTLVLHVPEHSECVASRQLSKGHVTV